MHSRTTLLALVFTLFLAGSASAQGILFGPHVGYDLDWEALNVGVQGRMGVNLAGYELVFNPSVEYYFVDDGPGYDVSLFQINGDLLYQFTGVGGSLSPYAGAGLAISRLSYSFDNDFIGAEFDDSDLDFGLNLIGGATLQTMSNIQPFGQAILTLGDGSRIGFRVGVLIGRP